ncbi:MAG: ABC transporter permease [Pyrinomonadaceae bacterium]
MSRRFFEVRGREPLIRNLARELGVAALSFQTCLVNGTRRVSSNFPALEVDPKERSNQNVSVRRQSSARFLIAAFLVAALNAGAWNVIAAPAVSERESAVRMAISRADVALMTRRRVDGSWAGDIIMAARQTAYYILASNYCRYFDQPYYQRSLDWLIKSQQPNGTWGTSALGPTPPSVPNTAVALLALEVAGVPKDNPRLVLARRYVSDHGGLDALDPLTQTFYSAFGRGKWDSEILKQFDVKMLLLPADSSASLWHRPAWWREAYVPIAALRAAHSTEELSLPEKQGLRKAEEWLLSHQTTGGAWFTSIPTTFAVMALHDLDPVKYRREIEDGFSFSRSIKLANGFQRPFELSVWDTSIALVALRAAGRPSCDLDVQSTLAWLQASQTPGGLGLSEAAPGGWSYNPNVLIYPDADDTSMSLWATSQFLGRSAHMEYRRRVSVRAATDWLLYMQGDDGGWATFLRDDDKDNDARLPTGVEDPSIADITGHALSALASVGYKATDARVQKAIEFLERSQTAQGSWYGRWGLSYLYGTAAVLMGLKSVGADMQAPFVRKAEDWLISNQNQDGGWGERFSSWDPARGISYTSLTKASTPEQTAWVVMGLLGDDRQSARDAVEHGIDYLLANQTARGDWPGGSYSVLGIDPYSNTLYATHWPLMALGFYQQTRYSQTGGNCSSYELAYAGLPEPETGSLFAGGAADLSISLVAEDADHVRLWIENKGKYQISSLEFSLTEDGVKAGPARTWSADKLEAGSRKSWRVESPTGPGGPFWNLQLSYSDVNSRVLRLERSIPLEAYGGSSVALTVGKWIVVVLLLGGIGFLLLLALRRYRPFLSLGFRNLSRHRLRTGLTSAGVVLGTAAIGATLTLSLAFRTKMVQDFATFGTNRIIVLPYQVEIKFGPPANTLRRIPGARFNDADVAAAKAVPQVSGASGYNQEDLAVEHNGQSLQMTVKFVDPESYWDSGTSPVGAGRLLAKDGRREVVLGYAVAHDAFEMPVEVSRSIRLDGNDYTVVGVMKEVGGIRGRQGTIVSPDITVYAPLDDATSLTGRNYFDGIEVRTDGSRDAEAVAQNVEETIKRSHGGSEFSVVSSQRLLQQVDKLLSQFTAIVVTIGLLTLVVSGIGVANMMLIGIHERVAEIGIMKAMGARDRTVLIIFLSEAAGIGLVSSGIGCVLGFGLLLLLKSIAGVTVMAVAPYLLFFSLLFSLSITIVCGSYPALIAARMEPSEAVRHG